MTINLDELRATLDRMNRARLGVVATEDTAEREIEETCRASVKLAVYGTLAPGEVNHHHVADLGGAWQAAAVRGERGQVGHGIHRGLPGMRLDAAAPLQAVRLLVSARLPGAWARLDAFEGEEMQRLLVPLEGAGGVTGVANIYALRRAMTEVLR